MTNEELNQYILHYLTEDKTNSAIMLTGYWGTGKSYYIQHSLKPFLEKDENGKHQCVVVSLYGLKDTAEISKGIYLGTRLKFLDTTSEKAATAKIAGKTIVKGVAGFFGVDLSKDEKDLKRLYESIDLTGKLIVLEDLERSGIDILEVLGYVNSLVEQDGVKVLLVANEQEILKTEVKIKKGTDGKEKSVTVYTESTEQYLRIKEKTVSDTIIFEEDFISAIQQIIISFDNELLNRFANAESAKYITEIMSLCKSWNLRSFIFACQKTVDIYQESHFNIEDDSDFTKTVFYGIIAFSHKSKCGKSMAWSSEKELSVELALEKYPLFRFCYDYIVSHSFDTSQISTAKAALKELRQYSENSSWQDDDLQILYNWHVKTETDVLGAVKSISDRLKNEDDISFYEYGRLAVYLIVIKHLLGCNIDDAKRLLVKNLYNKGNKIDDDFLFTPTIDRYEKQEVVQEYEELKSEMVASLNANDTTIFNFDYQPSNIHDFYYNVRNNDGVIIKNRTFASRLDADKVVNMLKQCSASEISDFRSSFLSVYRYGNIKEYLSNDKDSINIMLSKIEELQSFDGFDKIQKIQIQYFANNLKDIFARL